MLLTEGQISDHKGAAMILPALPPAHELLGDRGSDSDWFRAGLIERGIAPCIRSTRNRTTGMKLTRFGGAFQAFAGGLTDASHSSALLA